VLLTRELRAPNGIALSPSSRTLYVSNAERSHAVWMAYDLAPDGTLGGGRVFFDATPWTRTKKGTPDGMKVDTEGNLFAAGPGGVHVFAPDGTHLGSLELDVPTSNVAWGGDGSADAGGWVARIAPSHVQREIERKQRMASAARATCDALWLVIVHNLVRGAPCELSDGARAAEYTHGFDRLFWLDPHTPRVIELRTHAG
jgi:hypothetical protein